MIIYEFTLGEVHVHPNRTENERFDVEVLGEIPIRGTAIDQKGVKLPFVTFIAFQF